MKKFEVTFYQGVDSFTKIHEADCLDDVIKTVDKELYYEKFIVVTKNKKTAHFINGTKITDYTIIELEENK